MMTLILTLVAALNTTPTTPISTNDTKINKNDLYQHWVMSPKESSQGTIVYRPYEMAKQKNIPKRLMYAGLTFEKGGKLRKHRWRKVGNDRSPSFEHYNWELKKKRNGSILNIASKVGNGQNYKVEKLNKNMLKIRLINRR